MTNSVSLQRLTAGDVIRLLDLKPHPEGGHFRETFRDAPVLYSFPFALETTVGGGRAASTAIYFLLARGECSHWHRINAVEVWHWYAGAPLALEISREAGRVERLALGCDLAAGERPQAIVPAHVWQAAQTCGDWTLCGCTVAPGFEFSAFELAPKDWSPQPVCPRSRRDTNATRPRPGRPRRPLQRPV